MGWSFTTQQAIAFSGAVAGEEWKSFARGVFRTHILYFILLFCFTLFILLASFYIKNPKKLESLVVVTPLLLVHHAVP
jgi:hypothetical protein